MHHAAGHPPEDEGAGAGESEGGEDGGSVEEFVEDHGAIPGGGVVVLKRAAEVSQTYAGHGLLCAEGVIERDG